MNIFLHICCAPCSVACIQQLREEGHAPTGFWYNPNIHPFLEYKARRDTLRQYAQDIDLPLVELDDYGLREFTAAVAANSDARCSWCYARRFEETAKTAAQRGFSAFTMGFPVARHNADIKQEHRSLVFATEQFQNRNQGKGEQGRTTAQQEQKNPIGQIGHDSGPRNI